MPARKILKKGKRKQADSVITKPVPASPAKKAKTSPTSPDDRPCMTLASESIKRTIKNTSWHSPPPRLPYGPPSSSSQRVKLREKDEVTKQVEKDQEDQEEQQQQQQKKKKKKKKQSVGSGTPPLPVLKAAGQAGPYVPPAPASASVAPTTLTAAAAAAAATQKGTRQKRDENYDPMKRQAPNPYPPMLNAIEMTTEYYIKYHVDDKVPAHRRRQASLEWLILALNDENDPSNYRANLLAVLRAYRRMEIVWTDDDLVTYWYGGEMVAGPKKFDVEEFRKLAAEREDPKGLWVEGLKVPAYLTLRP